MAGPWEAYQQASADGPWKDYQTPAKKAEPAYDPTDGMSFLDKTAAGAGKAVVDLYRGGKQLLGVGDQAELQRTIDEEKRLSQPLMHTAGGVVGNLAGNVAALAIPGTALARGAAMIPGLATAVEAAMAARPIAAAATLGAGSGAVQGALEPVATGESRGKNMAVGAGIGAAGGILPGALARVAKPNIAPEAQQLIEEGVRLTPGQAAGGAFKRIEDAATSLPVIGDVIKRAQVRGIEDFNRAVYARALTPFGEEGAAVVKNADVGRKGIAEVGNFLSAKYEQALSRSAPNVVDDEFLSAISALQGMVPDVGRKGMHGIVPEALRKDFDAIMQAQVLGRMTPAGTLTPSVAKEAESELGRLAAGYSGSADFAQRELGGALRQAQQELRGLVARNNPEAAPLIQAANDGWSVLAQMERAGSMVGARDGIFTPAQFLNAVKRGDTSVRDRKFARGEMRNQDIAESAKSVMPSSVPDSGTASRIFTGGGIGALAGHGIGIEPTTMALAAAGMLPYTNIGGKLTLAALTKRPEFAGTLAEILRAGAPAGGIASGLMAPLLAGP